MELLKGGSLLRITTYGNLTRSKQHSVSMDKISCAVNRQNANPYVKVKRSDNRLLFMLDNKVGTFHEPELFDRIIGSIKSTSVSRSKSKKRRRWTKRFGWIFFLRIKFHFTSKNQYLLCIKINCVPFMMTILRISCCQVQSFLIVGFTGQKHHYILQFIEKMSNNPKLYIITFPLESSDDQPGHNARFSSFSTSRQYFALDGLFLQFFTITLTFCRHSIRTISDVKSFFRTGRITNG